MRITAAHHTCICSDVIDAFALGKSPAWTLHSFTASGWLERCVSTGRFFVGFRVGGSWLWVFGRTGALMFPKKCARASALLPAVTIAKRREATKCPPLCEGG